MITYCPEFREPGRERRFEVRGAIPCDTKVVKANSLPPAEDETGAVDDQAGIIWQSRYDGPTPKGADHPPIVYDVRWDHAPKETQSVPANQVVVAG